MLTAAWSWAWGGPASTPREPPTCLRGASCLTAGELGAALADRAELLFHGHLLPVKLLGFPPPHPQP